MIHIFTALPAFNSCKYRILAIITRPLSETQEFSEVQCRYFAPEKLFAADLSANGHPVHFVNAPQDGRDRLNSVPDACKHFELFSIHPGLSQRPVYHLSRHCQFAYPFEDLRTAVHRKWAVCTLIPVKGNVYYPYRLIKPVGFRRMSCWTVKDFRSLFIQSKALITGLSSMPLRSVVTRSTLFSAASVVLSSPL